MINLKHLQRSFRYAFRGLLLAAHENTFRVLLIAALIVAALIVMFPLSAWQVIALILVTMMVFVLEVLNMAFERIADLIEPRMHRYVRELKDLLAAAVLIASLSALCIGIVIFIPYFQRS